MSFQATGRTVTYNTLAVLCDGPGCTVREDDDSWGVVISTDNYCPEGWYEVRRGEHDPEYGGVYDWQRWHFHSLACLLAWVPVRERDVAEQEAAFARAMAGDEGGGQ